MSGKTPESVTELIPVSLLTGFLGSGKTTVLVVLLSFFGSNAFLLIFLATFGCFG